MDLRSITGFEWDDGNLRKNQKHGVTTAEIEQVFLNRPVIVVPDQKHSSREERFIALGLTNNGRRLTVVFTLRQANRKLRPISARSMSRRERLAYEEEA